MSRPSRPVTMVYCPSSALNAARAVFEKFGYRLWVERTDAELQRIVERLARAK